MKKRIVELVSAGVIVSESIMIRESEEVDGEAVDDLMLEASQQYEEMNDWFAKPVTSNNLLQLRDSGVPIKTKQSTNNALV